MRAILLLAVLMRFVAASAAEPPVQQAPMPFSTPEDRLPHPAPDLELASAEARLTEKLGELERLHREIDALRQQIGLRSSVIAHITMAELDLDKLQRLASDWQMDDDSSKLAPFLPTKPGQRRSPLVDAAEFRNLLDAFRRSDLLEILSEPTIVSVRNRRAQFDDGSTLVEFTPTSIGNEVRFELRVRHSQPANFLPVGHRALAKGPPPPQVREITTGGALRPGQGLVLSGLAQTRNIRNAEGKPATRNVGLLVFIALEQFTATPLPPVAAKPSAAPAR
jgi:hypothetical protein